MNIKTLRAPTSTRFINTILATKEPHVLILDEINIFAEQKDNKMNHEMNSASVLWLLLDKCATNPNILIIATANDVTKLPPQLKDRFEGNIIEISAGDWNNRLSTLKFYLSKGQHLCDEYYLIALAQKTEGFSHRQLEALVKSAYQDQFIITGSLDFITPEILERAYQRFIRGSEILQSKSRFHLKKWIIENSLIIQTVSTSVNLSLLLVSIGLVLVTGKTLR